MTQIKHQVSSLPDELQTQIQNYLWGSSLDWKKYFVEVLSGSDAKMIKHIGELYSPSYQEIHFGKDTLFGIIGYRNGYILQFLRAIPYQRRGQRTCEIEDEVYCHVCGEKTVFPFTRFMCHDCERYHPFYPCPDCGERRIRGFCPGCSG